MTHVIRTTHFELKYLTNICAPVILFKNMVDVRDADLNVASKTALGANANFNSKCNFFQRGHRLQVFLWSRIFPGVAGFSEF